jgi:peptidoglycan-associated lipoprotein
LGKVINIHSNTEMIKIKFFALVALVAVISTGLVGCKKTPKGPTPIPSALTGDGIGSRGGFNNDPNQLNGLNGFNDVSPIDENLLDGTNPDGTIPAAGLPEFEGMLMDREPLKTQTVYFDFDSSEVKASEFSKLDEVLVYLQNNPNNKLLVEGHCDERGTDGYNMALGERRAQSLREFLVQSNVNADRIRTISYGESIPAEGYTVLDYEMNRRGEFVVLLPKE